MISRRIVCTALGLIFLFGSMTLLAAPTREEQEVAKYAKVLKSSL